MIEFHIEPFVGVGAVRLGATRAEVHQWLGPPVVPARDNREMFFDGLFVDYDETGHVEFIELTRSEQYRATYRGIALLELAAEDAVAFVSGFDAWDPHDWELGRSYTFLRLQLCLWRGTVPEDDQPDDDPDGCHFETVGVGRAGYFTASPAPE